MEYDLIYFLKNEDDLNFLTLENDLIFLKMEDDLILFKLKTTYKKCNFNQQHSAAQVT